MLRTLKYYWKVNLAVVAAAAVTTAVLTGALLVGDSVRASLLNLALDRLGSVDHVILSPRPFPADLSQRILGAQVFRSSFDQAVPLLSLKATARHPSSERRASDVSIHGVDAAFWRFWDAPVPFSASLSRTRPKAVINRTLAAELDVSAGDAILVSLERVSDIKRDTLLGEREPEDQLLTFRVEIEEVLPDRGAGAFSLQPRQGQLANIFFPLEVLQGLIEKPEAANLLLLRQGVEVSSSQAEAAFGDGLREAVGIEDFGLQLLGEGADLRLESVEFVLGPSTVEAVLAEATDAGLQTQRILTYLANQISIGGRSIPYSTVTAVFDAQDGDSGLLLSDGQPASLPEPGSILLNEWAARDLEANPGDPVSLEFFRVGPRDSLTTERVEFVVAGVTDLEAGLGGKRSLTPEFPGIQDQQNMADWDPPFPVDLDLVRPEDEEYWDSYRGTPKAFVSSEDAVSLWRSRYGEVTSIRLAQGSAVELEQALQRFRRGLALRLFDQGGFQLRPVRREAVEAASGPTDFSGLFLAFSFFLIISAGLLTGLLFRLGLERRARESGLLLAIGLRSRRVAVRLLKEGAFLASLGGLLGLAGGAGYAAILLHALRTWWRAAVGTSELYLELGSEPLVIGFLSSLLIVILFLGLAIRRQLRLPVPALLSGARTETSGRRGKLAARVAWVAVALAALSLLSNWFLPAAGSGGRSTALSFFLVGTFLLVAGLSLFSWWCGGVVPREAAWTVRWRLLMMASRSLVRSAQRSLLCVALVASACFVLVAVGANRVGMSEDQGRESGTGGFALIAESDVPIYQDFGSEDGLFALGIGGQGAVQLGKGQFYPVRLRPGDDTSCLNLYRPDRPRILGLPADFRRRGGFAFDAMIRESEDPWSLLEKELEPGVVPAFGDHESVQWILHSGLGEDLEIEDEMGRPVRLRLVGLLRQSIFQSEILISEENFQRLFPSRTGFSVFLADFPQGEEQAAIQALEKGLADYGVDAVPAADRLASFLAVQTTYMATFQALGGLGLLLGTIGLGVVLIRNVIDRTPELAALRSFGFRRKTLGWLVVLENLVLLAVGVFLGAGAALVASGPQIVHSGNRIPWESIVLTLALVLAVGLLASVGAVRAALRIPLLSALRND